MNEPWRCPDCSHGEYIHGADGCAKLNGHDEYCDCSTVPPVVQKRLHEERLRLALRNPCSEHKRYQVKRKPTSNCEKCWRMWLSVNP